MDIPALAPLSAAATVPPQVPRRCPSAWEPPPCVFIFLLLAHQRTATVSQRPEGLVARHRGNDLRQVPFALRLLRSLDLHQVHVADDPPVLANAAVLGHEVVD